MFHALPLCLATVETRHAGLICPFAPVSRFRPNSPTLRGACDGLGIRPGPGGSICSRHGSLWIQGQLGSSTGEIIQTCEGESGDLVGITIR